MNLCRKSEKHDIMKTVNLMVKIENRETYEKMKIYKYTKI